MYLKVIASSFYAILAYERFHRNALLLDSGETYTNNYFQSSFINLEFQHQQVYKMWLIHILSNTWLFLFCIFDIVVGV